MSLLKAIVIALVVATLTGCVDDDPSTVPSTVSPTSATPVVLDYSPTHSDIGALLYLASHPDVDLLAVTLPGTGEADCVPGTRNTRQLLALADLPDVPVGCGRDEPLKGHRDWPDEWRKEANKLPRVLVKPVARRPVLDAEALLSDVLEAADDKVTVVAVGPLTNLAVTLTEHPELVSRIERVVIMGGAVDVEGNVPDTPSAEWNLYVDPEAARIVVASGVPILLVPLDATNDVPFGRDVVLRLGLLETPTGRAEYQRLSAQTWFDGAFMWDELTAVAAMRPDTVTIEQRRLAVDADGATLARDDGSVVDVAVAADAAAFDDEFRRVLNGGTLPPTPSLTAEEAAYLDTLSASLRRAGKQAEAAFDRHDGGRRLRPGDGVHHGHGGCRHRHRGRHATARASGRAGRTDAAALRDDRRHAGLRARPAGRGAARPRCRRVGPARAGVRAGHADGDDRRPVRDL